MAESQRQRLNGRESAAESEWQRLNSRISIVVHDQILRRVPLSLPLPHLTNASELLTAILMLCAGIVAVHDRFVEKNRREVEEKTEQLKAISNISALFALCAVVNLTQLNIKADADPAPPLVSGTVRLSQCHWHSLSGGTIVTAVPSAAVVVVEVGALWKRSKVCVEFDQIEMLQNAA